VIEVDGQLVGGWKRVARGKATAVTLSPAVTLSARERSAVEREAERFGRFLETDVAVSWPR